MRSKKVDANASVPTAWVDLLDEHDAELGRVRLFWRRGKGRYRPILRDGIDPAGLENASMADWDAQELPETNLVWFVENDETAADRRRRVKKLAQHFWSVATQWAHRHGPIIDAQLRGYNGDGAIMFEAGKRCNVADATKSRRGVGEDLIGAGFPMAVELSRIWTSRMAHAIPEFKTAQQAMAYLGLTLNEVQLRALFTTDDSIASFMDRLAEAAQVQDEREAIAHLVGLEKLFRNKKWFDVATAEQQIASRYILGRAAIYRMGTFGEG